MAIGKKTGGRKKGIPNKATFSLAERMARIGCDPFLTLALIANGQLPCGVCKGEGRTAYQPAHGDKPGVRVCQSCWGSGEEKISPLERLKAAGELAQYLQPKRKAIEHTGPDAGPIEHKHEIVFVD